MLDVRECFLFFSSKTKKLEELVQGEEEVEAKQITKIIRRVVDNLGKGFGKDYVPFLLELGAVQKGRTTTRQLYHSIRGSR